jgi:WD40 repeat protein
MRPMSRFKARIHSACLALVLGLMSFGALADGYVLKPVEKIGGGWRGWMSFVAFNKSGTMVASDGPPTSSDVSGDLTLWTFPKGRFVRQLSGAPSVLSPNWRYFVSDNEIRRLDGGPPVISTGGPNEFVPYAFSRDSRFAAASPALPLARAGIAIFSLPAGKWTASLGSASPFSLAFSPDGKTLAAGYWDFVALWSLRTHERIATFRGFGRYVQSLSFSPDGRLLAGGTDWGTLQIWDVARAKRRWSRQVEGGYVSQPAFSPSGKLVAIGTYGTGTVWLMDARTGVLEDHKKISDIGCGSSAFSPDGRYLITPSTGGLITWPYDSGGTIRVFKVVRR